MARIRLVEAAGSCVLILREALGGEIGDSLQLPREITRVRHDPLPLRPDSVGVEIQLVHALFGCRRHLCSLLGGRSCHLGSVLGGRRAMSRGVGLSFDDDLISGVMRLLQDSGNLTTNALKRTADSDVRAGQLGLQVVDLAVQLRDVRVDLYAVIATP
jgi:hypothetical protein